MARGVRRECMERGATCGSTAKSSQSAPDAAAIPFRQIAELMLVVQGEEPVRGWAHRGVSTPTHQCARFSRVGIIIRKSRRGKFDTTIPVRTQQLSDVSLVPKEGGS